MTTMTDTPNFDGLGESLDSAQFSQAARSVLNGLRPMLGLALPAIRRINWRIVAVGVVAGAAAYVVRSMLASERDGQRRGRTPPMPVKPPELNRWENEGGMIATSVPASGTPDAPRRADSQGDPSAGEPT